MKISVVLVFVSFLLVGCFGKDPKVELAGQYWQALVDKDEALLVDIVDDPTDERTQMTIKSGYTGPLPVILESTAERGFGVVFALLLCGYSRDYLY